jgi:hypothetical protein
MIDDEHLVLIRERPRECESDLSPSYDDDTHDERMLEGLWSSRVIDPISGRLTGARGGAGRF